MKSKAWLANSMMIISIVAVCVIVPAGFIVSNSFSTWLKNIGIHANPNLAGGYPVAEFEMSRPVIPADSAPADALVAREALSLRRFSVKKVAFRRWSGMSIAPRLNLCFEFDGPLPDPHNSSSKFSATTIHVYIQAPGKTAAPVDSGRLPNVELAGMDWNYQVIVDGFHEQARIFDTHGTLVGQGLGLYVESQSPQGDKQIRRDLQRTTITAGLPLETIGDPSRGNWRYYVLVGLSDSRNSSMILHSYGSGALELFGGALAEEGEPVPPAKPRLRPLIVSNRL